MYSKKATLLDTRIEKVVLFLALLICGLAPVAKAECPKGTDALGEGRTTKKKTIGYWEGEEPRECKWKKSAPRSNYPQGVSILQCPTFTAEVTKRSFSVISKQGDAIPFYKDYLAGEKYFFFKLYYDAESKSKIREEKKVRRYSHENAPKAIRYANISQVITPCLEVSF